MQRFLPFTLLALFLFVGIGCDSNEEDDLSGDATVTGVITESQTGEELADALVRFARGNASVEAETDSTGTFTIDGIATGTYTVTISADGYIDVVINGFEVNDGTNTFPQTVITETPPAGAYRIVLSWGQEPDDLDSHLTGPDGENGRFHVYYANEEFGDVANLDDDDTDSFGPETITLTPSTDGMYRYSVHNYSDRFSDDASEGIAGEIEDSVPARVQVYTEQGLVREYLAPDAEPGNTWRVFEMEVSDDDVDINDVNEYVDADGSGDIEVFRMPGK